MSQTTPIDDYISGFPEETQAVLTRIRTIIGEAAPDATEVLSYGIPTYDLDGTHLVHYGGFKHHVGFYPTPSGTEEFAEEISQFKGGKGSVRFPLGQPLPEDLIRRIVEFRAAEIRGRA